MFEWVANPEAWIALATLTALEIVLGIDNIIFISIVVSRLPEERRAAAGPSLTASLPLREDEFDVAELETALQARYGMAPHRVAHLVRTHGLDAEELRVEPDRLVEVVDPEADVHPLHGAVLARPDVPQDGEHPSMGVLLVIEVELGSPGEAAEGRRQVLRARQGCDRLCQLGTQQHELIALVGHRSQRLVHVVDDSEHPDPRGGQYLPARRFVV